MTADESKSMPATDQALILVDLMLAGKHDEAEVLISTLPKSQLRPLLGEALGLAAVAFQNTIGAPVGRLMLKTMMEGA